MGESARTLRVANCVEGSLFAAVGEINQHPQFVHTFHDLKTEVAQAAVHTIDIAIADKVTAVVRQLDYPDTLVIKQTQAINIALKRVGILKEVNQSVFAGLLGRHDIAEIGRA